MCGEFEANFIKSPGRKSIFGAFPLTGLERIKEVAKQSEDGSIGRFEGLSFCSV